MIKGKLGVGECYRTELCGECGLDSGLSVIKSCTLGLSGVCLYLDLNISERIDLCIVPRSGNNDILKNYSFACCSCACAGNELIVFDEINGDCAVIVIYNNVALATCAKICEELCDSNRNIIVRTVSIDYGEQIAISISQLDDYEVVSVVKTV